MTDDKTAKPDTIPVAGGEPVPDLTDERVAAIMEQTEQGAMHVRDIADVHHALLELKHRRAAQTASAERVRAVVREAADMVIQTRGYRGALGAQYDPILDAIAVRVAAQLTSPAAGAPPKASETRILDLQAAVGYEIERRDAVLARVAELDAAVARMAPVVAAAEQYVAHGHLGLASAVMDYRAKVRGAAGVAAQRAAPTEGTPG